jgi:hypothetical protein
MSRSLPGFSLRTVVLVAMSALALSSCAVRGESQAGSPAGCDPGMTSYDDGLLHQDPPGYIFDDLN